MPEKISLFVKNEASISLTGGSIGDFFGSGIKYSDKSGTYEAMAAFRGSKNSKGGFGEFKYTTPEIVDNLAFESRTRVQLESAGNSVTTRLAGKYSTNLGKFNIYEIAGSTVKFSMEGKGAQSVTPVSLTGIGYNVTPKLNCYVEAEASKSYNLQNKSWSQFSPAAYIGIKYTF